MFRNMRHKGGLGAAGSHPAVFPVARIEAVLTAFSDPGDLNYEPLCGSDIQLVAAERAGRRCFAMELDPVYCDGAVRRWEMATRKGGGEDGRLTQLFATSTVNCADAFAIGRWLICQNDRHGV